MYIKLRIPTIFSGFTTGAIQVGFDFFDLFYPSGFCNIGDHSFKHPQRAQR